MQPQGKGINAPFLWVTVIASTPPGCSAHPTGATIHKEQHCFQMPAAGTPSNPYMNLFFKDRKNRNQRYLTEMEKSPGEFWLARTMKEPTPLALSIFSAAWRDTSSWNQLSSATNHRDKLKWWHKRGDKGKEIGEKQRFIVSKDKKRKKKGIMTGNAIGLILLKHSLVICWRMVDRYNASSSPQHELLVTLKRSVAVSVHISIQSIEIFHFMRRPKSDSFQEAQRHKHMILLM